MKLHKKPSDHQPRKEMSHAYSVKQSEDICKTLNALQLGKILSDVHLEHLKAIIHSVFMLGYKGKVVNTALFSERHRTSVAHFLNNVCMPPRMRSKTGDVEQRFRRN